MVFDIICGATNYVNNTTKKLAYYLCLIGLVGVTWKMDIIELMHKVMSNRASHMVYEIEDRFNHLFCPLRLFPSYGCRMPVSKWLTEFSN
jgi:hypothetical protein